MEPALSRYLLLLLSVCAWAEEPVEVQALRERLTEREDETRVEEPFTIQLFRRPLTLTGQYEISLDGIDRLALGDPTDRTRQLLFEQQIETELFYVISKSLSFFAQFRFSMEEDLDPSTPDSVSDLFVERGEMWVYWEKIAGLPLSIEVGRLNFEDDRRWWWDDDLDAVRLTLETDTFAVAVAIAREVASKRSDRSYVDPDQEDVYRILAEVTWDWHDDHAIELFVLYNDDRSRTEQPLDIVAPDREDESDAELLWLGLRASGGIDFGKAGLLGYWLDVGTVHGDEQLIAMQGITGRRSEVEDVTAQRVRGWGFDAGITWLLHAPLEPRLTLGFARGSGDRDPDDTTDRSYRQSGIHANEPGFGGVQSFRAYGRVLDPELSNLSILTVGLGCTVFKSSSLDLVFHDYRLVEDADSLRDSRFEATLTGQHRALGQGLDLVLAIEESKQVEFEISAAVFRAGSAFGPEHREWNFAGFIATRIAF